MPSWLRTVIDCTLLARQLTSNIIIVNFIVVSFLVLEALFEEVHAVFINTQCDGSSTS